MIALHQTETKKVGLSTVPVPLGPASDAPRKNGALRQSRLAIDIWRIDLSSRNDRDAPNIELLGADEARKASRFCRQELRARFEHAHVATRIILGLYLGTSPADVKLDHWPCPICGGPHGKPVLSTVHGAAVHFNLTHSGDLALLAVSRGCEVGIDVETAACSSRALEALKAAASHPDDLTVGGAEASPAERALNTWTAKEAVLKASGVGLAKSPNSFPLGQPTALASLDGSQRHWYVILLPIQGSRSAALAFSGSPSAIRIHWFETHRYPVRAQS